MMVRQRTNVIPLAFMALALGGCEQGLTQVTEDDPTTTTEGETDTQSETETEADTSTFVPDDDMPLGTPACDPFGQDCPMGEKCVPYSSSGDTWDANKCVPVTGDGQPGDTCTSAGADVGTDNCGPDSLCWDTMDVEGEQIGVCTSFCTGTADHPICDPQSSCLIANEGSITLCISTCDPLLQDCGDGLGCFWANSNFNCVFYTDGFPTGEACGYINDCAPGNLCTDASTLPVCAGSACCASYCDLAAPTCGALETECVSFFEEGLAPPGYEDVGICLLPA